MIRLLSLIFALVCFLIGAVFLVNALMVTFDTIFAGRDASIVLAFVLIAVLAVKAGESIQFTYEDWSTRKIQKALHKLNGHTPTITIQNQSWMSPYREDDTQELPRVG